MNTFLPPCVNFHAWPGCDMDCRFCFSRSIDAGPDCRPGQVRRAEAVVVAAILGKKFQKVTLAGGEPTICPFLLDLCRAVRAGGAICALTTNGAMLVRNPTLLDSLAGLVQWIAVSVDSTVPATHAALGRALGGVPLNRDQYVVLGRAIRERGIGLKVNTVVTRLNVMEDMSDLVSEMGPRRWKVFQAIRIDGSNDRFHDDLAVSADDFRDYVRRHRVSLGGIVVAEDADAMTASYAMVSSTGRFFDNSSGRYTRSRRILDVGIEEAFSDVRFDMDKFLARCGTWSWGTARAAGGAR